MNTAPAELDFFQDLAGTLVARYPESPGFKRSGTSEQAAQEMQGSAPTLRDSVLSVLKQRSSTADEVAQVLGKTPFAIRPRLSELKELGLIQETQLRRKNASQKLATVWQISAAPITEAEEHSTFQ